MRIVASAMKTEAGQVYSVACPGRHHDVIALMKAQGISAEEIAYSDQGFLTDTGEYVDRTTALDIALDAGQVLDQHQTLARQLDELYSEFVW